MAKIEEEPKPDCAASKAYIDNQNKNKEPKDCAKPTSENESRSIRFNENCPASQLNINKQDENKPPREPKDCAEPAIEVKKISKQSAAPPPEDDYSEKQPASIKPSKDKPPEDKSNKKPPKDDVNNDPPKDGGDANPDDNGDKPGVLSEIFSDPYTWKVIGAAVAFGVAVQVAQGAMHMTIPLINYVPFAG